MTIAVITTPRSKRYHGSMQHVVDDERYQVWTLDQAVIEGKTACSCYRAGGYVVPRERKVA